MRYKIGHFSNANHSTSEKQLNTPILSLQFIDQPSMIQKPIKLTFYPTKVIFFQLNNNTKCNILIDCFFYT